jgi:hypothetical protein
MKKNYLFLSINCLVLLALGGNVVSAQVQLRSLNSQQVTLNDINDSGQATQLLSTYDFATNTFTAIDAGVVSLNGISNNGDLLGTMPIVVGGQTIRQPAYKQGGVWHPMGLFPDATAQTTVALGGISENGNYITGTIDGHAFLYNVATSTLEKINNPSGGLSVNNSGIIAGWYKNNASDPGSIAAFMSTGSIINDIPNAQTSLPQAWNRVYAINNNNTMVGTFNTKPFIYDLTTNTYTEIATPMGYHNGAFTSISDNGIAVGSTMNWSGDGPMNHAMVYHPSFGNTAILLREILAANGVAPGFAHQNYFGEATAISADGNYMCGKENYSYGGWAVNFDNLLLSTCLMYRPSYTANAETGVVTYELPTYNCPAYPGATLVLSSGFASGSVFPEGTTTVTYNLVDADGTTVINTISFDVNILCRTGVINTVTAITAVGNHLSSATSTSGYEDFTNTDTFIWFYIGFDPETNILPLRGNTGGNNTDYYTVFIDWNNNGAFENATERYEAGTITNSTGTDGNVLNTIIEPPLENVIADTYTKMRVVKDSGGYVASACQNSISGQIEDYRVFLASGLLSTPKFETDTFKCYPNPVDGILTVSNNSTIESISIYTLLGQEVIKSKPATVSAQLDVSGLASGTYLVKATSGNTTKMQRIIKK